MTILAVKTGSPSAEIYIYDDVVELARYVWIAHRQLANELPQKVQDILNQNSINVDDIEGIVCFGGSGSFTGLRIGHTFANTLAYSLQCNITDGRGDAWLEDGINDILRGVNKKILIPEYGAEPNITSPSR